MHQNLIDLLNSENYKLKESLIDFGGTLSAVYEHINNDVSERFYHHWVDVVTDKSVTLDYWLVSSLTDENYNALINNQKSIHDVITASNVLLVSENLTTGRFRVLEIYEEPKTNTKLSQWLPDQNVTLYPNNAH